MTTLIDKWKGSVSPFRRNLYSNYRPMDPSFGSFGSCLNIAGGSKCRRPLVITVGLLLGWT